MRTTKVIVSKGKTVNTGNYNSQRAEFTIEVELAEGETATQAKNSATKVIDQWLLEELPDARR